MIGTPSTNGSNGDGRDSRGRFAVGNRGGPGNPHARRAARLRSALLRSIQPGDVLAIFRTLIERAKAGDTNAARLVLDRVFGRPSIAELSLTDPSHTPASGSQRPFEIGTRANPAWRSLPSREQVMAEVRASIARSDELRLSGSDTQGRRAD